MPRSLHLLHFSILGSLIALCHAQNAPTSLFEGHNDIGAVVHPGAVQFNAARQTYTVTGGGGDMWDASDEFHFVWKKISGDVSLAADIAIAGKDGEPHRKGVLMIRQSLDTDSAYVDAALHADGLTAIQARHSKGAITDEVQSFIKAPKRLRIEKRGRRVFVFAGEGANLQMSGGGMQVAFEEPYYVGIGVCAHHKDATETVVFSNVELKNPPPPSGTKPITYSTIEVLPLVYPTDRRAVLASADSLATPTWSRDGKTIFFTRNGRLERVAEGGGKAEAVTAAPPFATGTAAAVSPDGTQIAYSSDARLRGRPEIVVLPLEGGALRRVTTGGPALFHGWSPDGQTIAFSATREGKTDIYTASAAGGGEKKLTSGQGRSENPEYSPDGAYIYFNSDRRGSVQVWRMKPDGSDPEQVTFDDFHNWFPHVSPDGKFLLFLSYAKNIQGHPANVDVALRVLALEGRKTTVLASLIGGPGSLLAPSWSPDSKSVAFVSYQLVP